ncbi:hypothetical protein L4Z68_001408 [Pseudomonas aeruginosa]|nr:hypothetical protein [Pseudomonas aeruginosa]EKX2969415.1 hypothetical protein [Pseudomonas aeruginosa]
MTLYYALQADFGLEREKEVASAEEAQSFLETAGKVAWWYLLDADGSEVASFEAGTVTTD